MLNYHACKGQSACSYIYVSIAQIPRCAIAESKDIHILNVSTVASLTSKDAPILVPPSSEKYHIEKHMKMEEGSLDKTMDNSN